MDRSAALTAVHPLRYRMGLQPTHSQRRKSVNKYWGPAMYAICRSGRRWFFTSVFCGAMAPALGQPATVMEPLSGLTTGDVGSAAYDISADGTVVVGANDRHGFRWSPGSGIKDFGNNTYARNVSADGKVVVGGYSGANRRPFRWTAATGIVELGTLPGFSETDPVAISANGAVVVGVSRIPYDIYEEPCEGRAHAFRWTAVTGMEDLGVLPGASCSFLGAVSADGKVVVGHSGESEFYGRVFRWTAETGMQDLGFNSTVSAVSADGAVIVGHHGGGQAFRWTAKSGLVHLDLAPGFASAYANDVSADGSVVVGSGGLTDSDLHQVHHAFRWTAAGGMVDLGVVPGSLHSVADVISADGKVVVGFSIMTADDHHHPFRWSATTGIVDLGELSGVYSYASAVSVDGRVVVGYSGESAFRAYIGKPPIEGTTGRDQLMGGAASDVIAGGMGADVMTGLAGNDTYYADTSRDVVSEASDEGTDTVRSLVTYTLPANVERLILLESSAISGTGNALANTLVGNSASNILNGKEGNDTLTGKAGRDRFVFDTMPSTSTNYDTLIDFRPVDDTIRLDRTVFTGLLVTGPLLAAAFVTGTTATTAAHRILYDAATGDVRYDADGTGPTAAVRFVTLATRPTLTSSDFYVQ